jgi:hypothetical protein
VSQISKAKEQRIKRMNLNVSLELHDSFKSVTAGQGKKHDRRPSGVYRGLRHEELVFEAESAAQVKRAALYMRVSSLDQYPETQLLDLRQMALR